MVGLRRYRDIGMSINQTPGADGPRKQFIETPSPIVETMRFDTLDTTGSPEQFLTHPPRYWLVIAGLILPVARGSLVRALDGRRGACA
jgi:hypothetical protein